MAVRDELVRNYNTAVASNMFLDVSHLKSDGIGSQIVETITDNNMKMIEPLPIISDNYHTYYLAMHILGDQFAPYALEYLRLHGYGQGLGEDLLRLLDQRAQGLKLNKVIDVSDLDRYSPGYEITTYPTGASDRKWIGTMPIISNSYFNYATTISLLPSEYGTYSDYFVIEYGSPADFNLAMSRAALRGNINMVRLMIEKRATNFNSALTNAAEGGYMNIVNLMIEKGAKNFNLAMGGAAKGGHMDIVNLMLAQGANNFDDAMEYAAKQGHIDIVRLMAEKGATKFNSAILEAALNGHIDIVKLLIEKGATNFANVMDYAAYKGHIDIVNLMIEKGVNDFNTAIEGATRAGHMEIVELLQSRKNLK